MEIRVFGLVDRLSSLDILPGPLSQTLLARGLIARTELRRAARIGRQQLAEHTSSSYLNHERQPWRA